MFTFSLPILGPLAVSISQLRDDPMMTLRKFPLTKSITQVVPGEFLIVTEPLALTNRISLPKQIVAAFEVSETGLIFRAPADISVYEKVDGWVEGQIESITDDISKMEMSIVMQTTYPLGVADSLMQNAIICLSAQLANRFNANMRDEDFANTINL